MGSNLLCDIIIQPNSLTQSGCEFRWLELGVVTNGMFVSPPSPQAEILPKGDGAFGKWVGREGGVSLGLVRAHSGPSEDSETVAVIDKTQIWPSSWTRRLQKSLSRNACLSGPACGIFVLTAWTKTDVNHCSSVQLCEKLPSATFFRWTVVPNYLCLSIQGATSVFSLLLNSN